MITCKTCNKGFPKPVRRGRPPSQCDDCKAGKTPTKATTPTKRTRKAQKPVEPPAPTTTPTKAAEAPTVALRGGKKASAYTSGFCNRRHAPDIHKLCSTIGGCVCACHKVAS